MHQENSDTPIKNAYNGVLVYNKLPSEIKSQVHNKLQEDA
jgi:hypothetical protein